VRTVLPDPEFPTRPASVREELIDMLAEIRRYRAAEVTKEVRLLIQSVAANEEVSQRVIAKVEAETSAAHRIYFRMCAVSIGWVLFTLILSMITELLLPKAYLFWTGDLLLGSNQQIFLWLLFFMWVCIAEVFILRFWSWRRQFCDAYVADYLIRALEIGMIYYSASTQLDLRDRFAMSIQRAATRYCLIFRRSSSSRFFASQVRSRALRCRDNIIGLVPMLVTADRDEIYKVNVQIVRLLIRSQTGYWFQTDDIAAYDMPMLKRDSARISLASFAKDRSIQVAFITLTSTLIGTVIASLLSHLR
jgi:hypothetical protein